MGYSYRGVPCLKSPIDIAIYMRLLWDLRPKSIIEIGAKAGGSALLFHDLSQLYAMNAQIVAIDINLQQKFEHDGIRFLKGDVCRLEEVFTRHGLAELEHPWLVVEDSAHTYEGCLSALNFFATAMRTGDVLVVEDGILDELGLSEQYNGGPNRALREYLNHSEGVFDILSSYCDMFGLNTTYNPNGYLTRL